MTEREAVLHAREAFMRGWHQALTSKPLTDADRRNYAREAATQYPLPKIQRPRVLTVLDPALCRDVEIRRAAGVFEWRGIHGGWSPFQRADAQLKLAEALISLRDNPDELVDDDGR